MKYCFIDLRPFQKVGSMIADRLDDIVSYFTHPITNGPQKDKLQAHVRHPRRSGLSASRDVQDGRSILLGWIGHDAEISP